MGKTAQFKGRDCQEWLKARVCCMLPRDTDKVKRQERDHLMSKKSRIDTLMSGDINFKAKYHQLSDLFMMVKGVNYLIHHKDMTTINV